MSEQEKQVVGVRFTQERVEEIEARAEAEDITKSEFIRQAVAHELGDELLKDRIELLEDIAKFLLEETAPNEEIEYLNSPNHKLLTELRDDES